MKSVHLISVLQLLIFSIIISANIIWAADNSTSEGESRVKKGNLFKYMTLETTFDVN